MATTLIANFATRREAEMTVERLVQELGVERTDIFVAASGSDNTAGQAEDGADTEGGAPTPEAREDAPLAGPITVSVDIERDDLVERVRSAFAEFDADAVSEN